MTNRWKVKWPVLGAAALAVGCASPGGEDDLRPGAPDIGGVVADLGDGCGVDRAAAHRLPPPPAPAAGWMPKAGPVALPVMESGPLSPVAVPPRSGQRRDGRETGAVALRLLILTATGEEPAYAASRAALDRLGVPYDVFVAADGELGSEMLLPEDGPCLYRGVILTEAALAVQDPETDEWISALGEAEWEALASFEQACAAREVIWYGYPEPGIGMSAESSFESDEVETALVSEAGAEIFPYVRGDAAIPVKDVWGYRGQILDPEVTRPLLTTPDGHVLSVVHQRPDGTEVLAMTADSNPFSVHSQLLEYGIVDWLSQGLFLGQRRAYMAPQIDDVFLATEMWVPGVGPDPETLYRIEAADVERHVQWQDELRTRLPEGSSFVSQLAFNGNGTLASVNPDTSLVDALRLHQGEFQWINHTWDHTNMDEMSHGDAVAEIVDNCDLAATWDMPGFSCAEAVTPQISGLDNPESVVGMLDAGVRVVVSDTSVTAEINPNNPGTNPSHNTGRKNPIDSRLFQVPRHPTNIFYNCSTPEELVDMYNELYADYFGAELSYAEILEQEAILGLHYLLAYDADPLMFHQANMRTWTEEGGVHSLYIDWVEEVLDAYTALVDLPVLTLTLSETAALMQARDAYDRCGVLALLVEDEDGERIELSSRRACTVPLTGLEAPAAGEVDHYAGVPTTHVQMDPCEPVSIPLP